MTGCIELSPLASSQPASQQDRAEEIKTQTIQDAIANPPSQGDEAALKADGVSSQTSGKPNGDHIPWSLVWKLYLSHFLSTWNSRSFEFGSVLFLAAIYPGTLFYLSVYAIIRSAAAIVTASPIGRAIDQRARLGVVQWSIGKLYDVLHPRINTEPCCSGRTLVRDNIWSWLLGNVLLLVYSVLVQSYPFRRAHCFELL